MNKIKYLLLVALISFISCTENQRVKQFGGSGTIVLPKGQKLINVTWKDDNLWYITRPMNNKDSVEVYTFKEDSSFGLMNGEFVIKESK